MSENKDSEPLSALVTSGTFPTMCNASQERLEDKYDLGPADSCPVCQVAVGRHRFLPPTVTAATPAVTSSTSSSFSSFQLGKNTTLPRWKVDHHHAKPFLDQVEHRFIADGVHKSVWPRLLLKAITNVNESSWVNNNIVEPGVDWATARILFTNHFEVYSYSELLQKDYERCKQGPKESVQLYSDRFMELVSQLRYDDDNELVILHFLEGLNNTTQGKIREHIRSVRRLQSSMQKSQGLSTSIGAVPLPLYDIKSLKEMVDIALDIDRSNQISTSTSTSSTSPSTSSPSSPTTTSSSSQKKFCANHPHMNSHTTAECKFPLVLKPLIQDHRQLPPLQPIPALLHSREDRLVCCIVVVDPSNVMLQYATVTISRTTPLVRVDLNGQHGLPPLFRRGQIHRHLLPRRSLLLLNRRIRLPPLPRPRQPPIQFVAMQSTSRQAVRPLHRLHRLLCQRTLFLFSRALSIAVSLQLL